MKGKNQKGQIKAIHAKRHRAKIVKGIQEKIHISSIGTNEPVIKIKSVDPLHKHGITKSKYLTHYETKDGKLIYWDGQHLQPHLNVERTIMRKRK